MGEMCVVLSYLIIILLFSCDFSLTVVVFLTHNTRRI